MSSRIAIPQKVLFYIFLIQAFFSNYVVNSIRVLYYPVLLLKVTVVAYLLLVYWRRKQYSSFTIITFLFNLVFFVSTVINHGSLFKFFGYFCTSIGFTLFADINRDENFSYYEDALAAVFRINIYLNLLLMVVKPNGLSGGTLRINFLGMDNLAVPVVLCGFAVMLYHDMKYKRSRWLFVTDSLVCITSIIMLWSGTGLIGCAVFVAVAIGMKLIPRFINYRTTMAGVAVAFFMIVIANSVERSASLLDFLGKDMTFTGRTYIWAATIKAILSKPLLGYGIQESEALVYNYFTHDMRQAHNEFLQTTMHGGLIALALFLVLILIAMRRMHQQMSEEKKGWYVQFISSGVVCFLVLSLTETYGQYFMSSILLSIGYFLADKKLRD